MKLIVGLGNPGTKYQGTRHNVGFDVLDQIVQNCGGENPRAKFDGLISQVAAAGEKLLLLWPQTFMNRSGGSVRKALDFYHIEPTDLLVVCDEFQLPLGSLRLRPDGSAGGHNGLADVIRAVGTQQFARLRIGIGPAPPEWDPADFVLGKFAAAERDEAVRQTARAGDVVTTWAASGVTAAMNQFNAKQA